MKKLDTLAGVKKGNIIQEVQFLKMADGSMKENIDVLEVVKSTKHKIFVINSDTRKVSIISKLTDLTKLKSNYYLI